MASTSRRRRGAETQRAAAEYFAANGWEHATDTGAGRGGRDLLGIPGISVEVKARRGLDLTAWLRQAAQAADGDLPMVVHRPDGFGLTRVDQWPVTLRLGDLVPLLRRAGFGDPLPDDQDGGA